MKHYIAKLCFALLALFISLPALADDTVYSATVMDTNDEPLMGATVKVLDTPNITVTDLDGNFTIKVPKGGGRRSLIHRLSDSDNQRFQHQDNRA